MKLQNLACGLCVGLFFCTLSVRPVHAISGTVVQTHVFTPYGPGVPQGDLSVTVSYTWSSGFAAPNEQVTSLVVPDYTGASPSGGKNSLVFVASGNGSGSYPYTVLRIGTGNYVLRGKLLETNNGNYVIASDNTPITLSSP